MAYIGRLYAFLLECCAEDISSDTLYACVRKQAGLAFKDKKNSTLSIISYTTDSISEFSAYSLAINNAYAQLHGYKFLIGGPTLHNFEPDDARWNKVFLLLDSLNPTTGWARNNDAVVWIDADLCFLDFKLDFINITYSYPDADIILSKDLVNSSTIGNSGLIIVRNTKWSRKFLYDWWYTYDRKTCCDQDALTWLYQKLSPKLKSKFALLPSDALNSNFPSWKNQLPHNPVLHLAGATSLYRSPVFRTGWSNLCSAYRQHLLATQDTHGVISGEAPTRPLGDSGWCEGDIPIADIVPAQLGLTRELQQYYISLLPQKRYEALLQMKQDLITNYEQQTEDFLSSTKSIESYVKGRETQLQDILKEDDEEKHFDSIVSASSSPLEANEFLPHNSSIATNRYGEFSSRIKLLTIDIRTQLLRISREHAVRLRQHLLDYAVSNITYAEFVRNTISVAFELTISMSPFPEYADTRLEILEGLGPQLVDPFVDSLPVSLKHRGIYYQFKYKDIYGSALLRTDHAKGVETLIEALDLFRELEQRKYFGTDYVRVDPYKEGILLLQKLGAVLCMAKNYDLGLEAFREANHYVALQYQHFENNVLATYDVIRQSDLNFAEMCVNNGICLYMRYDNGGTPSTSTTPFINAQRLFESTVEILDKYGIPAGNRVRDLAEHYLTVVLTRIREIEARSEGSVTGSVEVGVGGGDVPEGSGREDSGASHEDL